MGVPEVDEVAQDHVELQALVFSPLNSRILLTRVSVKKCRLDIAKEDSLPKYKYIICRHSLSDAKYYECFTETPYLSVCSVFKLLKQLLEIL
jgi:hypothetical protein